MKIIKNIDNTIFREYDIRGIYGVDLNDDIAYTIGRAFASYIKKNGKNTVILGHDNRISSPALNEALIKGLTESGANVIDLGLVTTPMYYFAKIKNKIESGIMITASHNPTEYNGFKISFDLNGNAYGKYISDFKAYLDEYQYESGVGVVSRLSIEQDYLEEVKNSITLGNRRIKVVVDCGNGTGSIVIKKILDMFDIEYDLLYCTSDGSFPNHHPDPSVEENMQDLAKRVKELNYDFGIGIDGDADRVGIVDEKGNFITADKLMIIIYRNLVYKLKNKKALLDVKCSRALIDELNRLNIEPVMHRTGNSYMNIAMIEGNFDFGGELSGHLWFRDKWLGFDDGIYAGLRLLEILSNSTLTFSYLLEGIKKYYSTNEEKIKVTEENKFKIVERIKNYCIGRHYNIVTLDGVRVEFNDSWCLVRASNTGPNLTVRFEASSESRLESLKEEFLNIINVFKN